MASPDAPAPAAQPSPPAAPRRRRRRRWLFVGGTLGGVLLFLGAALVGAEYYTSRPSFCGTCHIMDPYYESWSHDSHGIKHGVKCVDCHYAPGEQHTIKAKFKGLSQVASYFSGRYGAGRPRAQVADASCLRSSCHGDGAHLGKLLPMGEPRIEKRVVEGREVEVKRGPSVHFVHEKHLDPEKRIKEVNDGIAAVRARLEASLGPDRLARVERVTAAVNPANERRAALGRLAEELALSEAVLADAQELDRLEHRRVRLDQLGGLNCSACHAFNPSLSSHFTADRQVCFTCHFTHEDFNRGTAECLGCHEPPSRAVSVHGGAGGASDAVVMDHQDIVKRKIDCASCHLDVLRGDARVTERDCTHCHDQSRFMVDFATRTTETVRRYHEVHIANQRAHCFDCHRRVQHGLLDPAASLTMTAGFLEPVLNQCQNCHPNHHREQVALLTGTGGAGLDHSTPSGMLGSRLNCRACHTQTAHDAKGDETLRATQQGCIACHGKDYAQLFDQWKAEIKGYLDENAALLERVEAAAKKRQAASALPPRAAEFIAAARHNIDLVRGGGGLHNRAFALQLLDRAHRDLLAADALLGEQQ